MKNRDRKWKVIKLWILATAILRTSALLLHTGRLQWKLCACRTAQGPGLLTPHHILRWATLAFESGSNFKISHVLIPQAWFHLINKLCFQGPTRLLPLVAPLPKPILQVSTNRTLFSPWPSPATGFGTALPRRTSLVQAWPCQEEFLSPAGISFLSTSRPFLPAKLPFDHPE